MGRRTKLTQEALAVAAGVSRQAISQNPHVKRAADGSIDLQATSDGLETLLDAQRREQVAKANIRQREDQEKAGLLVPKAAVIAEWSEIGVRFRDALMGMPARIVNRLPDEWRREVHRVVDEEARKALAQLSDEIRPVVA